MNIGIPEWLSEKLTTEEVIKRISALPKSKFNLTSKLFLQLGSHLNQ